MADEKRFLWAKLPRCPVLWPVQAVEDSSLKVKVYCYSDHAELVINKTSTEPFPGPFEDYKDKGIAVLKKKNLYSTLNSFLSDADWAWYESLTGDDCVSDQEDLKLTAETSFQSKEDVTEQDGMTSDDCVSDQEDLKFAPDTSLQSKEGVSEQDGMTSDDCVYDQEDLKLAPETRLQSKEDVTEQDGMTSDDCVSDQEDLNVASETSLQSKEDVTEQDGMTSDDCVSDQEDLKFVPETRLQSKEGVSEQDGMTSDDCVYDQEDMKLAPETSLQSKEDVTEQDGTTSDYCVSDQEDMKLASETSLQSKEDVTEQDGMTSDDCVSDQEDRMFDPETSLQYKIYVTEQDGMTSDDCVSDQEVMKFDPETSLQYKIYVTEQDGMASDDCVSNQEDKKLALETILQYKEDVTEQDGTTSDDCVYDQEDMKLVPETSLQSKEDVTEQDGMTSNDCVSNQEYIKLTAETSFQSKEDVTEQDGMTASNDCISDQEDKKLAPETSLQSKEDVTEQDGMPSDDCVSNHEYTKLAPETSLQSKEDITEQDGTTRSECTDMITERVDDSECESDTIPVSIDFPQLTVSGLKKSASARHVKSSKKVAQNVSFEDDLEEDSLDEDIDENLIIRDSNNPELYIRKVAKSLTTKGGKMKKDSRVYNSYHFCTFCEKLFSNFSQHMERNHMNEEDVKSAFETENKVLRKRNIALLNAEMNNANNLINKKKGKGEILLFRRPSHKFDLASYGPCPKCLFWVSKKMMHRHQFNCVVGGKKSSTAELLTQSDMISGRIEETASSALVNEVFKYMQNDPIGKLAKEDQLIISLGNMWMEKNVSHKLKRGKYTSQIMRLVARLLFSVRELTKTDYKLSEYLKACYFNDITKATLMTAGLGSEDEEYLKNPSNAVKLGYDIKRLLNINIGLAILRKDKASREESEDFLRTMNVFWGTRVTKLARTILAERQFNKRVLLPDANDIQKLNEYLNTELLMIDTNWVDLDNYIYVAKLLCAKLVQYNRRRPGEIESARIEDFDKRVSGAQKSNIIGKLTRFEKQLLENQDVLEVRGKGHQGVPIIIPEGAKTGMKFISDCAVRKEVGINMESPYLFATTGENVFRVYDALSYNCRKADLQYPERITCTNLRKYMATITQVLDLKPHQLEWVLKHMGHTLDVHKIYYRATSDVIERTQIAKILLLQDSGRLPEFSNKSLEDIQLTDLAEPDETGEMAAQDGIETDDLDELLEESENMAQVEDEFTNEKIPSRRKNRQKNSSKTRQRWSPDEEEELRKIFHKCFDTRKRPTPRQCLKAINISRKNNGFIYKRKKDVLKKKMYRMIAGLSH